MMNKLELKQKIEEWAEFNLFWGTSCVETPFETPKQLLDDLFEYLNLNEDIKNS